MICGYRELGLAPGVHRGLPSPYLTLIITLDEPCTVAIHPDPGQPGDSYPALVGGLHVRPALVTHDGAQSGVQVALNPLAARAVLGVPAGELVMRDLHLDQLIGAAAHRLREQLGAAAGWPERFAIVEGFLRDRIAGGAGAGAAAGGSVRREVRGVWSRVIAQRGVVRIDELARAAGWSSRHLGEQFRRELGLSPKTAARVVRFDAARRRLPHTVATGGGVAELACASGYADQAHLTRDFRELVGCSHPDNILIHHFSIGSKASRVAFALPDRMVLVYHNITPPEYFVDVHKLLVRLCYHGRRELGAYVEPVSYTHLTLPTSDLV